jgi:spectinomycin phosphotransferase
VLTKPDIADREIVACLAANYDLVVDWIEFLPLGADQNSAVYRVVAADEAVYFLKLWRDSYDELAVALPRFLSGLGIEQIIAPLATNSGALSASLDNFKTILYPFVAGRNGYETKMPAGQWGAFGDALRKVHAAELPTALLVRIRRESFSGRWREAVRGHLARAQGDGFADARAEALAAYLASKDDEIRYLVERAERLALAFQRRSPQFVLCHADIHAGNLLLGEDGGLAIVDWDEAILAPKERDLMSIGGGLMGGWWTAEEEEALFYPAYGEAEVDPVGLAYYRYARIIEDIALISERIFTAAGSIEDRELFFGYLKANFQPDDTIEMAYRVDPAGGNDN